MLRAVWFIAGLAALCGCMVGPTAVQAGRAQYNIALQRTEDEQLLLNIVRLHYRDRPYFLEVSAVASQFKFGAAAGALAAFGSSRIEEFDGSVAVEETPTVSYAPLKGSEFARRMLAPIPLETLVLLSHSGWSIERLLRLTVQRLNGLPNAPTAAGPRPAGRPEFESFLRAAALLRTLQRSDGVRLDFAGTREALELTLAFSESGRTAPQQAELAGMLGLAAGAPSYPLVPGTSTSDASLVVQTRSFLAMLYYLSQAVRSPAADLAANRVPRTSNADGSEFDWSLLAQGLMDIRSSQARPDNPAVAVRYRGSWFYIDDADLEAKATFSLVGQVFALTSGALDSSGPVLTLPIGG